MVRVKGRLKPATMGAFKTGHFEQRIYCHRRLPKSIIRGFREIAYGKPTQNGYGALYIDIEAARLVPSADST